jgi:NADPH-dependent ferric siderophore reductase
MSPLLRTLGDAAANRVFRASEVTHLEELAAGFRLVRLGGPALRGVRWTPGQKLQLRVGGFATRTYTPMSWDPDAGEASFVAVHHGGGPGAALLGSLAVGDHCQLFGPRSSIDLTAVQAPAVLVGDEASIGLAAAWHDAVGRPARHLLEADDPTTTRQVLDHLGVPDAVVVPYQPAESLTDRVLLCVRDEPTAHLVLTGRAQTIKHIRAALKAAGVHRGRVTVKAYWDENRSGLD